MRIITMFIIISAVLVVSLLAFGVAAVTDNRHDIKNVGITANGTVYAKPVTIGNDCWFGASVTICPGVHIGNNCVIGAGSVVTRDIPENSFAAGVQCRVIREITEADSMKYKPNVIADNTVVISDDQK